MNTPSGFNNSFGCDRTCRPFSELCHFSKLLSALGAGTVMSNTCLVRVVVKNMVAVEAVAQKLGHKVLGNGTHKLYAGPEQGFGIQMKGWKYPVVFREDGNVAFDDYHGSWGNRGDIDALRADYTIEAAKQEANNLGWYCEQEGSKLVVHHPGGGLLTITPDGSIDASGFMGHGCAEATAPFSLALGQQVNQEFKQEYNQNIGNVNVVAE